MNFDTNVNSFERGSRLVLTTALIGWVLTAPASASVTIALVALYPAFTALMAWDPMYELIARRSSGSQRGNGNRISMNSKSTA